MFCFLKKPQLALDSYLAYSQWKALSLFSFFFFSPCDTVKLSLSHPDLGQLFAFLDLSKGLLMPVTFHLVKLTFSILAYHNMVILVK